MVVAGLIAGAMVLLKDRGAPIGDTADTQVAQATPSDIVQAPKADATSASDANQKNPDTQQAAAADSKTAAIGPKDIPSAEQTKRAEVHILSEPAGALLFNNCY